MNSFNTLTPHILSWLFNYLVHSTVLLGLASAAHYCGIPHQRRLAELVWRFALFGGLVTASLQLGFQLSSATGNKLDLATTDRTVITKPMPSPAQVPNMSITAEEKIRASSSSTPDLIDTTLIQALHTKIDTPQNDTTIQLPSHLQDLISALILTWLIYSVFVVAKIVFGVRHLNRLANAMPAVKQSDLNELLSKQLPNSHKSAPLRISSVFNSPFVCPNGIICLPAWVLEQSNRSLCRAMLHHEIQHIIRRDGAWRIAHEVMKNIFFFQILNLTAEKQLTLLAEIDCDFIAVKANGVDTFAQALVRCAEMTVTSKHPNFAIPMAKSTSLLQRIDFILNEDIMNKQTMEKFNKQTSIGTLSLGLIAIGSLSGICYAMPSIGFANNAIIISNTPSMNTTSQTIISSNEPRTLTPIPQAKSTDNPNNAETTTHRVNIEQQTLPLTVDVSSSDALTKQQQADKFEQAQAAYASKNYVEALHLFLDLAKLGHAKAQFAAGEMLWRGQGSAVNAETATSLLTQAANQGHPEAQHYASLFAQRAQHQSEINFYTQQFDGGKLKWTEQVCERPIFPSMLPSAKEYRDAINKLNANLNCYNNYVASLKQSLANEDYLHADLRGLMRADEIEQSKQLARNVYFDMGSQAMQHSQQMLTEFDQKNEIWRTEVKAQSGRQTALSDEMIRSHFSRMERRQVDIETGTRTATTSSNPNVAPTTK